MKKISDYTSLINELPTEMNSFRVLKKNWNITSSSHLIATIFNEAESIKISRKEIRLEEKMDVFIIKILMWGYPTKGRGNNIENLLSEPSFHKLKKLLLKYRAVKHITFDDLINDFNRDKIHGLGISTLSKFLYFLDLKIDGRPCVILDDKLFDIVNNTDFLELNTLKGIKRNDALKKTNKPKLTYFNFIVTIDQISKDLGVTPEKLEMFLFFFGKSL